MRAASRKRFLALTVSLAVAIVALPISNTINRPKPGAMGQIAKHDEATVAVCQILTEKCGPCHMSGEGRPVYAEIPIVHSLLERDIAAARERADYDVLFASQARHTFVAGPVLVKTQQVIGKGAVPPMRYRAFHWRSALSSREQATLLDWMQAQERRNDMAAAERQGDSTRVRILMDSDLGRLLNLLQESVAEPIEYITDPSVLKRDAILHPTYRYRSGGTE